MNRRPAFGERLATERQRDLLRRFSPEHPRLADPALSANEAWDLAGEFLPSSDEDATILDFFGDENVYNQTSAARAVDALLADPANASRWEAHPKLDARVQEAVHLGLQSVESWGIRQHVFDHDHMMDFDVYRTFRFAAEVSAAKHVRAGVTHMGTLRRKIREEFTDVLRAHRDNPHLPTRISAQNLAHQEGNRMALIACPDCGKEVSDQATSCIGCGRPLTKDLIGKPAPGSATATGKGVQRAKWKYELGNAIGGIGIVLAVVVGMATSFTAGIITAFVFVAIGMFIAYAS